MVVIPIEEYKRLEETEDRLWVILAQQAEAEGFVAVKESEQFLAELRHAKD